MGVESKTEYLIVDTSAFIKNASLQDIGQKIITTSSVVNEIKNKRQLKRLVVLPYDLEVKDAYPEDIKFVTEFAKKTGDYPSLSATDIQVIALTYRYEKEKVGTEHLKKAPEKKKEILDSNINPPDDQAKDLPGFYLPEGDEDEEESDIEEVSDNKNGNENEEQNVNKNNYRDEEDNCRTLSKCSNLASVDSQCSKTANDISEENDTESDYDTALSEEEHLNPEHCDVQDLNKKFEKLNCDPTELKVECGNDLTIDDILKPVKNDDDSEDNKRSSNDSKDNKHSEEDKEGEEDKEDEEDEKDTDDEEDEEESEDDDEGWITPSNFLSKKKEMESGVFKEKAATVACLTTDYAMQNVLLQIGLNVVSLDGKVIKEMRTFILRCYACFKTTGVVTKLFCPSCGNKTLKKVAISVDDEGNQHLYINYKKPLTSRGKKYSLPTYQGGKHACNPILFEDQPIPDQRPTKLGRAKNDPMNEDFIAGYSPFVMRDVNSRAAMLGIRSNNGPMKHWMKRNPNEVRKHRK